VNAYVLFLIYLAAILGFVAPALLLDRVPGPKPAPTARKLEPVECGAMLACLAATAWLSVFQRVIDRAALIGRQPDRPPGPQVPP